MNESSKSSGRISKLVWIGVIIIILCGLALRLAFLLISHPHVDEYSSIWAAMNILQKGVPILPSGFIYLQGILFTYIDALFIGIFGFNEWIARLPSLLASVLTIPIVFAWGRRAFGSWAGLAAAALTTFSSASIVWGGRARMYALQQVLLTLALYAFYRGYIESKKEPRSGYWRWLFALAFLGAVLSQTVTILVAPALLLCLLTWRRQWMNQSGAYLPLGLFNLSAPIAVPLNYLGGPVSSSVGRSFIDLSLPWRLKPEFFFREFFWDWPNILFTGLLLIGFVWLTINFRRSNSTGLLYLYALFSATLLTMIFMVGESWQRPRYLTMIQPVQDLLLVGVLHCIWKLSGRCRSPKCQNVLAASLWLGMLVIFLPPALKTIGPAEPAYDKAFHFVRANWQDDDAIVGPLPSIAGVYLGDCDGYLLQNGYEEYLVYRIWEDYQAIDRWTGAPLLDSITTFEQAFDENQRIWFPIDDIRWQQRYTPEFREYISQNMVAAYQSYGVTVFQRSGD